LIDNEAVRDFARRDVEQLMAEMARRTGASIIWPSVIVSEIVTVEGRGGDPTEVTPTEFSAMPALRKSRILERGLVLQCAVML
jgi:hypothetical protein